MHSAAAAELAGREIAKGKWLMPWYPAGKRDDAVFNDPFKFDIERSPNRHLAFANGAHVCLGQHLGRMEMRVLWEELTPRLQSLELDRTPMLTEANFVCCLKSAPIRLRMH
jgi:cytochrome P450